MNFFHFVTPLDLLRGIITPLETKDCGFITKDSPARARQICEAITPADMTGADGPPPFLTAQKTGPMRWKLTGPMTPFTGMYFEMQLVVEPHGAGSKVYEHNFAHGMVPGSALFVDFGHRLLTHLVQAYGKVSAKTP
jgi:hypothetical protein